MLFNINKKILYKKAKYRAFTLSEVLLTIVIIGVIAAMAIPSMLKTTQMEEYVAGLKKAHSTLANALYRINYNNGYPQGDYSYLREVNFIDELAEVTNILKKCDSTPECLGSSIHSQNSIYKQLNGTPAATWADGKAVITSDGHMFSGAQLSSASNIHGLSLEDEDNAIFRILVDVNGRKGPNRFGYDTFIFYIVDGKGILPAGAESTSSCRKTSNGATCAAKVIKEGKITY